MRIIKSNLETNLEEYQTKDLTGSNKNYSTVISKTTPRVLHTDWEGNGIQYSSVYIDSGKAFDTLEYRVTVKATKNVNSVQWCIKIIKRINKWLKLKIRLHEVKIGKDTRRHCITETV